MAFAATGLLLLARAAAAHDLWLEPATFRLAPGERVAVRLRVGDAFPGEPMRRQASRIERFALVNAAGESEVFGFDDRDPAGYFVPGRPGLHLLVYDSNHARLTLEGDRFERHLAEQGLERVSKLRRARGQSQAAATEMYSRCAKALLRVAAAGEAAPTGAAGGAASAGGSGSAGVGPVPGGGHDLRLGLPLELVPETDPYTLAGGGRLPLLLLYEGKPLAGAWVEARSNARPERVSGRTDAAGRVTLELPGPGFWLVKAVHMVDAPAGSGADWESWWASLTFDVPSAPYQ